MENKSSILSALAKIIYPVPYPTAIIPHAIYGVILSAVFGYRGEGWIMPVGFILLTVCALAGYKYYKYLKNKPKNIL